MNAVDSNDPQWFGVLFFLKKKNAAIEPYFWRFHNRNSFIFDVVLTY